ncbi:hypothetical protein PanWU01x14_043630 [Parasponia andersonii]|uniref:Uncharacterized protein n=1 Tax=Parasponia andersonii TaxID=3476 RepID=A0A2P5DQ45_PARAD|nr:hypothetical protein PanWU01x14_043630 [Parasponia andersonii]
MSKSLKKKITNKWSVTTDSIYSIRVVDTNLTSNERRSNEIAGSESKKDEVSDDESEKVTLSMTRVKM